MRNLSILFLLSILFISCSQDTVSIEFDNHLKTISVLNPNCKISTILINEMEDDKKLDSTYTSIDFERPKTKVNLKEIQDGTLAGMPIDDLLSRKNLVYQIVLKRTDAAGKPMPVSLLYFETSDIKNQKQIFKSDF